MLGSAYLNRLTPNIFLLDSLMIQGYMPGTNVFFLGPLKPRTLVSQTKADNSRTSFGEILLSYIVVNSTCGGNLLNDST